MVKCAEEALRPKPSLKELNLYFNIMNVKLCLLNQEMCWNLNVTEFEKMKPIQKTRFLGKSRCFPN